MPKASAANVADRILDGWSAGLPTVWPDRFAEAVQGVVGGPYERLLDHPRTAMTDLQTAYRKSVAG